MQQVVDNRPALFVKENLGKLGAGQAVIRPEQAVAVAAHQTIPQNVVHGLVIPCPHAPQVGEAAGGAVRAAVTGLLRIARQGHEDRLNRYGPAGHGKGVLPTALVRQPDRIPPAVGDGQSVQFIAAVRGNGQCNSAAAAGIGTTGGYFAVFRFFHGDGVGAGAPAPAAMTAAGRSIRIGRGSRPAHGDRGQAGHGKLDAIFHIGDGGPLRIAGPLSKIGGGEHMHHSEAEAAVCAAGIGQGDGQAPGGEVVRRGRRPGRATVCADHQRYIIDGGILERNIGVDSGDLRFHHRVQLGGGV